MSIAAGQRHAALALGMTGAQALRRIILPQAVVRMLPPIASTFITLVKDSSLVSLISVSELMWAAQSLSAISLRPVEILTGTGLLYVALAYPLSLLSELIASAICWRCSGGVPMGLERAVGQPADSTVGNPDHRLGSGGKHDRRTGAGSAGRADPRVALARRVDRIRLYRAVPQSAVARARALDLHRAAAAHRVRADPFTCGVLALTLNLAAFVAEIYRAGITSIGTGQTHAALALGMTRPQLYRRIILPQAIARVLPALGSVWVSLFKDTSILSVIGVAELMYRRAGWWPPTPTGHWRSSPALR